MENAMRRGLYICLLLKDNNVHSPMYILFIFVYRPIQLTFSFICIIRPLGPVSWNSHIFKSWNMMQISMIQTSKDMRNPKAWRTVYKIVQRTVVVTDNSKLMTDLRTLYNPIVQLFVHLFDFLQAVHIPSLMCTYVNSFTSQWLSALIGGIREEKFYVTIIICSDWWHRLTAITLRANCCMMAHTTQQLLCTINFFNS